MSKGRTKPKTEMVAVAEVLPSDIPTQPAPPPLEAEQPHKALARANARHAKLTEELRQLKADWASENIRSQQTHQAIATSRVAFVETRRRELHLELEQTQAIIGRLGKEIRELKARRQISRSRGNGAQQSPVLAHDHDGHARHPHADEEDTYLACFYQIAKDSLDPRQFAALEDGTRSLVKDYRQMHDPA
jgi:hypothetical protein